MTVTDERKDAPFAGIIGEVLTNEAPYLASVISKQIDRFGLPWLEAFENDLAIFFAGDLDGLRTATRGYIRFALDGMLLQKRFDKTKEYAAKTYEQASLEVYQNEKYMHSLYLPGIYLSHFLWRHHYLQQIFFAERFVPLVKKHGGTRFYDVGVGTGFYSRECLRQLPELTGHGFDLSVHSLSYTRRMVDAFGLSDRYQASLQDILANPPKEQVPFLINVEVLEHLEDPLSFLKGLYRMLAPGGLGLIAAAVTAPNADHIYLYRSAQEVVDQVQQAGFNVIEFRDDAAYDPRTPQESVPRNALLIVSKGND
jgi:2-polyprenyl-3-methyl-5-hydroxy-6-metoxy-1,4-benzoquinol methylase